ncbi:choline dehydrogenase [Colletotrichum higginsianum]|nr:choline dehydrogenase [Colletotrichum higginsianum]
MDPKTVTRSSAREAYFDNFASRDNLHLLPGHQVTKVLLTTSYDGSVKATGVEVSGIGDPTLLQSIGVPTVVDLPAVGQNLHDHILLNVVNNITAPDGMALRNQLANATFLADARAQYDSERLGPLASPHGDFLVYLPLANYTQNSQAISSAAASQDGTLFLPGDAPAEVLKGYQAQQAVLNERLLANDSASLEIIWSDGTYTLGLQQPYSRGSVKASSSSTFDAPLADAGFLRNPIDLSILVEGVKFTRKISATSAVQQLFPVEVAPGIDANEAAIAEFIRQNTQTLYHPAGSCKMGAKDTGGVVDDSLRVYGVGNLRIVDASVIPLLPASHTMTTVFAIAERAADIIREIVS